MALHISATMFPKSPFIYCAESIHTKLAPKNYILKIAYSKLASFNSPPHNEGVTKLKTFLKKRPHNHLSKKQTLQENGVF